MAFDRLEPFGDSWRQTARIVSAVLSAAGVKGIREESFMPIEQRDAVEELEQLRTLDETEKKEFQQRTVENLLGAMAGFQVVRKRHGDD
jgi:hypothetical protein